MGRRALPKIDPQLDLTSHFYSLDDLPDPWDPAKLFTNGAPLEIEVGSGKGLFLQNASMQNTSHNFLGIEVAYKYSKFCAARLAKRNIDNAVSVHGDGLRLFRELIPSDSLEAVHVYFPDPWWKKRHHGRRVLNEEFLKDVYRTLKPGGHFHFWTDVKDYYDATVELIAESIPLNGPIEIAERQAEHDLDYLTHFERRTRLNEEPVYRSKFLKDVS